MGLRDEVSEDPRPVTPPSPFISLLSASWRMEERLAGEVAGGPTGPASLRFPRALLMNSMKLVIPLHFISSKKTPNDAVTPQRQSQFTPKMKVNAVPRLLSSLV